MTRYLVRSSFVHFAAAAFLVLFLTRQSARKNYYTIDFIAGTPGPAPAAASAAPAAAKTAAAAAPAPVKPAHEPLPSLKRWLPKARAATLKEAEVAERSRKKHAPRLSEAPPAMSPSRSETSEAPTPAAGAPGATGVGSGQGGTSIGTDVSDFPYPWYLQRLRTALWNQWSQRMPGGGSSCVVTFTIARDGSVSDIGVTTSAGADAMDYAATSSVEAAAPFPPLPAGFSDPTLRVHVTFQSL